MKMPILVLSLLLATSLCNRELNAQQGPASAIQDSVLDQGTVLFQQETRNVLIDVIVTDKHGKPVSTLDKSKFTLSENGALESIAFFEEHDPAHDAVPLPVTKPQELVPGEYTNLETLSNRGPLIALLVDALDTSPGDMANLRRHLSDYLKQVPEGTHIALFTLTDKLRLVQGFTPDTAILKAAIKKGAQPDLSNRIADEVFAATIGLNQFFANSEQDYLHEDRRAVVLNALLSISAYLKELPGRKDLLWFAGDWAWAPIAHVNNHYEPNEPQLDSQRISDIFTTSRTALYPVDVRGLVAARAFDTGRDGFGGQSARKDSVPTGDNGSQGLSNLGDLHMWMGEIATATGGRAIVDTNDLSQAVARAEANSEHYYTLAYVPNNKSEKGDFRRIKISVSDPGVKLEYRTGYYARNAAEDAKSEQSKTTNPLVEVMQFGAANAIEIPFRIKLAVSPQQPDLTQTSTRIGVEAAKTKTPLVRYKFTWLVDLKGIRFSTAADGHRQANLTACLVAYDTDGKVLNHISGTLALKLMPQDLARFSKSGYTINQSFDLPAGRIFLRAGLIETSTGHTGATEFSYLVEPGKAVVAKSAPASSTQP